MSIKAKVIVLALLLILLLSSCADMYDRESFIIIKNKENIVSFDGMPESGTAHKTEFKDGIYTFTRVER